MWCGLDCTIERVRDRFRAIPSSIVIHTSEFTWRMHLSEQDPSLSILKAKAAIA